ncbi:hypothetical protein Fleli_3564 [Bernardetia litoralis DSM 6794]|uniref:PRC-barrel protein n=1 Tax=Bernardetia litoralis (strain ATCC 23117 / DSM 6794 / NBRC 15988 / NCIMB 1366 / Fx l1 / Sio-4) TaxID=880071 RepID=I4APJ8_BERLS|nr:hypothetical protein [Bernardetia litoralis]AFM05883.1 hypothetical protein Fleli_3564 [Bernardetia litoralis DSM 6794]
MEHKTDKKINSIDFHEEITLERLENLTDYKVADGYDNVMGWRVVANGELELGKVRALIASKELERILYLDIEVEKNMRNDPNSHLYVLIPIGLAKIDHDAEIVNVDSIDAEAFVSYPRYDGQGIHMDYEYLLYQYYAEHPDIHLEPFKGRTAKYYDHDLLYNQTTVYGNETIGF